MNNRAKNITIAILTLATLGLAAWSANLLLTTKPEPKLQQQPPSRVEQPSTKEFTSPKGIVARLNNWTTKQRVASPLTITGEIPGNWSFEASFPVNLADSEGKTIAQHSAHLEGDWMTTDYVPFTATLTFTAPTENKNGTLVLHKDNPSGLPQNDDAIEIPVTFN